MKIEEFDGNCVSINKSEYFRLLNENVYYQTGYISHMTLDLVLDRIMDFDMSILEIMECPMMSLNCVRSVDMVHNVVKGGFAADNSLLFEEKKGKIFKFEFNGIIYLIHEYDEFYFSVKSILTDEVISEYFISCAGKQLEYDFKYGLDEFDWKLYIEGVDLNDLETIKCIFIKIVEDLPEFYIGSDDFIKSLHFIQEMVKDYVELELENIQYLEEYKKVVLV